MNRRHIIVGLTLAAVAGWLVIGQVWDQATDPGAGAAPAAAEARAEPLVRGMKSLAALQPIYLEAQGQTRANRVVQVRSEVSGKVEALPGEKGARVEAGDLLCRIAADSRNEDHAQAQAQMESAQLEYDGLADLAQRGLQSDIRLAKARAALEASKAEARRTQLALEKTALKAPFAGLVDRQFVEVGDYLTPGDPCVTLLEIDPMLALAQIAEKSIGKVSLGGKVQARLITGEAFTGAITYIGHAPDAATRTYPIEATFANEGGAIRVGLTAELRVPLGEAQAHLISPASLLLDDVGRVGVHIVDRAGKVRFKEVAVVDEGPRGLLVTGLPKQITLITVGHEEVSDGQLVRVDYTPVAELVTF